MTSIGIREFRQNASQVLRQVREKGETIEVTYRGRVVALLVPAGRSQSRKAARRVWSELDALATEIAALWPGGVSAAEAVSEGRRRG